ncbi:MAG: MFS transporter [Ilumatobacteraceae bacterium]
MPSTGERRVLMLLALASIPFAFVNTLFTQTVSFAADEFDQGDGAIGVGAALVRWGVVLVPPAAVLADRVGRKRVLVAAAWSSPILASLGALSPSYEWLVASQTIARPLALVMNVMILVMLTEEMSRETRARSVGLVAITSSLGSGAAVLALPLADVSPASWRWLYVIALVFLPVAFVLQRELAETQRFTRALAELDTTRVARVSRSRLATQIAASSLTGVFVAAASVYLVNYLRDVRNYDAVMVTTFTIVTAGPAGLGIIVGGRIADDRGRRVVGALSLVLGTALVVVSFSTSGAVMWVSEICGGILLGISFPALSVYRGEMFPTAHRGAGAALVTASGLIGGSVGLVAAGQLLDTGWSYSHVMMLLALAPVVVGAIVVTTFPETAHRELEDISPDVVAD